jgi:TRAP-type C4-dicarboxylate transport system permease large subunit
VFAGNQLGKKNINHFNASENSKIFMAGCMAGVFALLGAVPVELIKVRGQNYRESHINYKKEILRVIKNDGLIGLYRGFVPALYRDLLPTGLYFLSYHHL